MNDTGRMNAINYPQRKKHYSHRHDENELFVNKNQQNVIEWKESLNDSLLTYENATKKSMETEDIKAKHGYD